MPFVTIFDEKLGRGKTPTMTLDVLPDRIRVRELIRARIYQEVEDYNKRVDQQLEVDPPGLLVTPSDTEQLLNGTQENIQQQKRQRWKKVLAEKQLPLALTAFQKNAFFVLVDDHQVEDLDEEIILSTNPEITFIKLVQLVGG